MLIAAGAALFIGVTSLWAMRARPEVHGDTNTEQLQWARMYWIVDYVRYDYYEALEEGELHELEEQRHLMELAQSLAEQVHASPAIIVQLATIRTAIARGGDPVVLHRACTRLLAELVASNHVTRAPSHAPDLERGRALYSSACVVCHGERGNEDPPTRTALVPRPPSFLSTEHRETLTPFRVVSALRFGIPGTAMATPPTFSDEDRWNIGFYVASMRAERCAASSTPIALAELASSTDDELGLKYGEEALGCMRMRPTAVR